MQKAPPVNHSKIKQIIAVVVKRNKYKVSNDYPKILYKSIMFSSRKFKMDPFIVTTTSYVESEFNPKSGPCIGPFQINTKVHKNLKYNVNTIQGNTDMGVYLLRGYYNYRGSHNLMWKKYSGNDSKYVNKCNTVLYRIKNWNIHKIEKYLSKPLWK